PAETAEPGAREDDGVQLAVRDLAQPGVDVPPDRYALEAPPERVDLRDPAYRPGADPGCVGQLGQGQPVAGHQHVTGVGPRRYGRDTQPSGGRRRKIFVRVDGEVDVFGGQRLAQGRHEDADTEAHHRCGRPVTGRGYLDQLHVTTGRRTESVRDRAGL